MKASRKLLYFVSIVGLVGTAALAVDRIGTPSMSPLLTWSVVIGVAAGAPGLIHRRAWPLALILVPLGAYLILRAQLPLPDSVHGLGDHIAFYRSQLRIGAGMYTTRHLPFDLRGAPELRILLSLVVYLVAATASFVALSMRKALPAIAIALALLGFGLTIDQADRVLWLPFVFLAMVGCVLALSHSLQRQRWKAGDALAGVGAGIVAAVLAFSLLGTTSVASSRPWQDWRTWGASSPHGDTRLSFDWMVNYPTLLDEQSDGQVMKVKSAVASYWRANALDYFDGRVWYGKASNAGQFTGVETAGSYLYRVPFQYPEVPGELVKQNFDITSLYTGYLLAGGTARELTLNSAMNVSTNPAQALKLDHAVGPGFRYQVTAVVPQVLPADLVDLGQDYPVRVLPYRELPFPTLKELGGSDPEAAWIAAMSESLQRREWLDLYRLNEDVVRDATDPYQIALLIEERLRRGYDYSLRPPLSHLESPYAAFLFDTRSGFCQQFAGAMAVMLRFNGIPARVAVGFATGDRGKDGWFVVKRTDAHAWVEAFFPGVGWVPFDPTPGRSLPVGATSSSSAGFIDPYAAGASAITAGAAASQPVNRRGSRPDEIVVDGNAATAPARETPGWLPWAAALAAALLVWPLARLVVRRLRLRGGGTDARLRASLRLVYAELRDHGFDVPASQTLEETALALRGRLGLDADPLVDRVQAVLYGGRAATEDDVAAVAAFRRSLRRRLRERSGWPRSVLALYGIRPAAAER